MSVCSDTDFGNDVSLVVFVRRVLAGRQRPGPWLVEEDVNTRASFAIPVDTTARTRSYVCVYFSALDFSLLITILDYIVFDAQLWYIQKEKNTQTPAP